MTQFSSKPPFNDDPEPWTDYWERSAEQWAPGDVYAPRPEYDRPQTNLTNRYLEDIRIDFKDIDEEIRLVNTWVTARCFDIEEIIHARKVLERIKAVFG